MSNPNLSLSPEEGAADFERKEQILNHIKFDWRDWLNNVEYETLAESVAIPLAVSRFNTVAAAPDIDAALIALKLSVMRARVSHVSLYE